MDAERSHSAGVQRMKERDCCTRAVLSGGIPEGML